MFRPCTSTLHNEAPHSPTSQVQTSARPGPGCVTRKSMRVHCGGSGDSVRYQRSHCPTTCMASCSAKRMAKRSPSKQCLVATSGLMVMEEAILNSATSRQLTLCLTAADDSLTFSIHKASLWHVSPNLSYMQRIRCSPTTPGTISCTRPVGFSQISFSKSFLRFVTSEWSPWNGRTSEPHQLKPSFTTPLKLSKFTLDLPHTVLLICMMLSSARTAALRGLRANSA
mmetsp:Transcript_37998/g.102894  ORF Transcript_37998/g.102894 Transcript_37998/m.102894 type:complete len:226 (-) Transcript_37998:802-1479(-)